MAVRLTVLTASNWFLPQSGFSSPRLFWYEEPVSLPWSDPRYPFRALTLLFGWQVGHPVCKNLYQLRPNILCCKKYGRWKKINGTTPTVCVVCQCHHKPTDWQVAMYHRQAAEVHCLPSHTTFEHSCRVPASLYMSSWTVHTPRSIFSIIYVTLTSTCIN